MPKHKLLSLPNSNNLKLKLKPLRVTKVNMTLNLNVLMMINISGVRGGHYVLECPNKRIIVMRYNGDVGFENDKIRL